MSCARSLVLGLFIYAMSLHPAVAEKRVALVIGNAAYASVPKLKNPRSDAEDMAAALQRLKFKVISGFDLDERGMSLKAREFAREVAGADVALFFYAGHGLQVNGQNYLAPINVSLKSEADLDFETLPLDLVLKQMRQARVSLVFLDACRDNPLTRSLRATTRSAAVGLGLARIEDATGMMISFSTQPGNVALDGEGRNSPYSKALLAHIAKPGISVGDTMIEVRKQVLAETGDKQVPWENSSLTGKFYFVPGAEAAPTGAAPIVTAALPVPPRAAMTVPDSTLDHTFWTSVSASNDAELYREYLRRFPNGAYAVIAQSRLAALSQPRSTAAPVAPEPQQQVAATRPSLQPLPRPAALPVQPAFAPRAMAEEQQKELKRVGCFAEQPDGAWGPYSMRAMTTFNARARTALPVDAPSQEAISTLKAQARMVCNLEAAAPPRQPQAQTGSGQQTRPQGQPSEATSAAGAALVGGIIGGVIGGTISRQRR